MEPRFISTPDPNQSLDSGRRRLCLAIFASIALLDLARRYDVGYVELVAANPGIDPWMPGAETDVVLPTAHLIPPGPHEGILINLAEQRLYIFPPRPPPNDVANSEVETTHEPVRGPESFPIGVSRQGWQTPLAGCGKT